MRSLGTPRDAIRDAARLLGWGGDMSLLLLVVLAAAAQAQQLAVKEIWEIGGVDAPPETAWGRVSDAAILAGRVYVADIVASEIRTFSLDAGYEGKVGGLGRGPGEFVRPSTVTDVLDTLVVYDVMQDRWSLFDSSGRHLRTTPVGSPGMVFQRVWPARGGWRIGVTALRGARRPSESLSEHYILAWDSITGPDTIAVFEGNPFWTKRTGLDSLVMVTRNTLGADGGAWVLGDSVLVVVNGVDSRAVLYAIGSSGLRLLREQDLPGERQPLSDRDRQRAVEWYYWRTGVDPSESTIEEFVIVAARWPAWSLVRGDNLGDIWLRRGGPQRVDRSAGEVWVRWSLTSNEFQELHVPAGVEVLQFGQGYAVGVRRDDLGVEKLVLFGIVRAPGQ